jgi:hypothetical protein
MFGKRTPLAIMLAVFCGLFGGGLAVDAQRVERALWFDHFTTIVSFLPLFLLARSWKWLICAIPGLIAGIMMIALRNDLVNRWPEVSRGPGFAMIAAWLLTWLPQRFVTLWNGGTAYAEYAGRLADDSNAPSGRDARRQNPFFLAGMWCLLIPPAWTVFAIALVSTQEWKRTTIGRGILSKTEVATFICMTVGILFPILGWIRHERFRGSLVRWLLVSSILIVLFIPIQLVLLGILGIAVNGVFSGGGK